MRSAHAIPVLIGNTIGIAGSCFAGYLIYSAPNFSTALIRFTIYLISIGCLIFCPHCLAHYIVGSLVGVHFRYYLVQRSTIEKLGIPVISDIASKLPVLSLQIDHASLASVSVEARAAMFASGALCSTILPFVVVFASINDLPALLNLILLVLCLGNLLFEVYYSPKAGDFSRIKRPLKRE
jgi:hypothetical protein